MKGQRTVLFDSNYNNCYFICRRIVFINGYFTNTGIVRVVY